MARGRVLTAALAVLVTLAGAGCGGDGGDGPAGGSTTSPAADGADCQLASPIAAGAAVTPVEPGQPTEPQLREELLALRDDDQAERTGQPSTGDDVSRAARLREIIAASGWPTRTQVGADGASAAWLIAQHADFDVRFQQEVLELMCVALAAGEADPVDVAYLEDRVAVNQGRPQIYGTQVSGCQDGRMVPAPIEDEGNVDQRRARVGLEPLADYLAVFDAECGSDQS